MTAVQFNPLGDAKVYFPGDTLYGQIAGDAKATLAQAQAEVTGFAGQVDAITSDIAALEGEATSLGGRATSLEGRATTLEEEATSLGGRATSLEDQATSLAGRATLLEGRSTTVEAKATALEGRATSLEGRATTVEDRATTLENKATAADDQIAALEGEATSLGGRASSLEGRATTLENKALAADDQLNPWRVTMRGPIFHDRAANSIRYPAMTITRNGEGPIDIYPGSYTVDGSSLADFAISTTAAAVYHYIDVEARGTLTASPVKGVGGNAVPPPAANLVYLGMTQATSYTAGIGTATVLYSRAAAVPDSLTFRTSEVILDKQGMIARDNLPAAYVPKVLFYRVQGEAGVTVTASNAETTAMPGFVRFPLSTTAASIVYYDPTANALVVDNGGGPITPSGKAQWIALVGYFQGSPSQYNGVRVIDYAANLGENRTAHGRTMVDMPRKFGTGPFNSVPLSAVDTDSATALSALGLTSGVSRGDGTLGVVVGDNLDAPIRGGRVLVRTYYYSSTGAFPATVIAYLRNAANNGPTQNMAVEAQITPNLRSYTAMLTLPTSGDMTHCWAGSTAGALGAQLSLWGMQLSYGPRQAVGIWPYDYPTPAASAEVDSDESGVIHKERLARSRMKAAMLLAGEQYDQVGALLKINVVICADSKSERPGWVWRALNRLRALYGDGGAGTIRLFGGLALSSPAAESFQKRLPDGTTPLNRRYTVAYTGSWAETDPGAASPSPAPVVGLTSGKATAAASVKVTAAAGLSTQTTLLLGYVPHPGAHARYRFTTGGVDGAWTTLDLSSGSVAAIAGALAAEASLTIEWVGGEVELSFVAGWNDQAGIVIHKVALSGSTAPHWRDASATPGYAAQMAALNPDCAVIYLGTNVGGLSADDFAATITQLVANNRAAEPWTGELGQDCLLVGPAVNFSSDGLTMATFQDALRTLSDTLRCAYVNAQDGFPLTGTDASSYAGLWDGGKHETAPFGMANIASTILPAFLL